MRSLPSVPPPTALWRSLLQRFTTAAPYEKKSSMDRKAELEKKKQKLAALRADKEKRRREKEAKDMEDATGRVVGGQDKDTRRYENICSSIVSKKAVLIILKICW